MDVLSDTIAVMRTGRPHSARIRKCAPWGVRAEPFHGAGFHVVLEGTCWLVPADGAPIALGPGDVVCLPHGRGHALADSLTTPLTDVPSASLAAIRPYADAGAGTATVLLCGAYTLDRTRPHPLFAELPDVIHLPARLGHHSSLHAAVGLLAAEVGRPGHGTEAVVAALLDMMLLYILRSWLERQGPATGWAATLRDPAVAAALRRIHEDPAGPWTVETLGAAAGLSRAAFSRRFTALVGRPPLGYLTWWRLTLAARLLRDGDQPVQAVARRVGYTSEFAFAKAFKREHGVAPGRYRRALTPGPGTGPAGSGSGR
ncbi:AraC family transcriptional regulator [Dactylosporangium matsuzakiense]|uniref:AraC family transcriptional regulator n=1 Tax=Dactylosporangium matsuzakiense TaxID=53360 RepID=A0A9W6KN36_9ACTN|nr:AraC family transcriptional regulator [Dactylosporangium matsuzakiense]UWZ42984.1 AraC family transcriptional regulator [Dactylosporangium matsuzakiense]GLL03306.1 AraC family transcriptional regulator [Dactylosporangium matsuzakiense]